MAGCSCERRGEGGLDQVRAVSPSTMKWPWTVSQVCAQRVRCLSREKLGRIISDLALESQLLVWSWFLIHICLVKEQQKGGRRKGLYLCEESPTVIQGNLMGPDFSVCRAGVHLD